VLARQVLYYLCHTPAPLFFFVIFQIGTCIYAQVGMDYTSGTAGMTGDRCTPPSPNFLLVEMGGGSY
jgi:hypothetical protein